MEQRNIIVIGASAGGFDALKKMMETIPADLDAALFIVWHMAPDIKGILPDVLNKAGKLRAAHAIDGELIENNRIYVAPPDRHLVIEKGFVRVTRGPKENRFRPAVDPLFRSAAYNYGARVIGIILSGALGDGTAGLWLIKQRGGTAIVQDPKEASVASMPQTALNAVDIDYKLTVAEIGPILAKLVNGKVGDPKDINMKENERTGLEIAIAKQEQSVEGAIFDFGELTTYACPECHGVLSEIRDGKLIRYRCHTGHAYSVDSLLSSLTEKVEDSLWNAIRGMDESIFMLNSMGDHFAAHNEPKMAAVFFKKAKDVHERIKQVRLVLQAHEQLTLEMIEADPTNKVAQLQNKEAATE